MPYRYVEHTADVAFEAWCPTLEGVFVAAADALANTMVEDVASIGRKEQLTVVAEQSEMDLLLFAFLSELVYLKDARKLLLRVDSVKIGEANGTFRAEGTAYGEAIAPGRHPLLTDVKAVTLHRFNLERTDNGWKAFVVLDI